MASFLTRSFNDNKLNMLRKFITNKLIAWGFMLEDPRLAKLTDLEVKLAELQNDLNTLQEQVSKEASLKEDPLKEDPLQELRARIVQLNKSIQTLNGLAAKVQDLERSTQQYQSSINKRVSSVESKVTLNSAKVDSFSSTYNSMVKTANKRAGTPNSQRWEDIWEEYNNGSSSAYSR